MALGQSGIGRTQLVKESHHLLDNMKYEIAEELTLGVHQGSEDYWGEVTSRNCGNVGGEMVRRLVTMGENELIKSNK